MRGAPVDRMPVGPDTILREIADLKRQVRELRSAIGRNGFILDAGGQGIRTSDFDGTDFANPGSVGNYFGGDGAVLNNLYLRPGSISNEELTNPLSFDSDTEGQTGMAITGTAQGFAEATLTVPDGFNAGVVVAITNASIWNTGAGSGFLYVGAWIGSFTSGGEMSCTIGSGGSLGSGSACVIHDFPSLIEGGTISVKTSLRTDASPTIPAYAGSIANTNAFAIFYRN